MNKSISPAWAAISVLPLLALALAMPSDLDAALPSLTLGAMPLVWATIVTVLARLSTMGIATVYLAVLPFSAYAMNRFTPQPTLPALVSLASAATAATALAWALGNRVAKTQARKTHRPPATIHRFLLAACLVGGSAPGLAITLAAGYAAGIAVSLLLALLSLLAGRRRSR